MPALSQPGKIDKVVENDTLFSLPRSVSATRVAFFIAGFSLATWAPMIPLARLRLMADNGTMGLVLLAFGIGSFLMMPLSGALASRYGCRRVFNFATLVMLLMLPALATLNSPLTLALALFVFGAGIGAMDVVVNIQAVLVEKMAGQPIMSGFHALFSIGGIAGSGIVSLLLICHLTPLASVSLVIILVLGLLMFCFGGLLNESAADASPLFVMPRGIVILLGTLCFIAYIMEGSMLDWSGILLTSQHVIASNHAGFGYIVFACAMTTGRLTGDAIIKSFGRFRVFLVSALIAAIGFLVVVSWANIFSMTIGFFLIGAGLSNIVPILFTAAGRQNTMPGSLAVAAISSMGYSGILLGPALIGGLAHLYGLPGAFFMVCLLSLSLPLSSHLIRKA
ncbi:MFS transporter [Erwinia sp. OLTSP20]|uniref:MFS transporter n=1 Tax=unclassified Erwinia TaxID=2622719 RepID=UPI000C52E3ED|nr:MULTISPECIES: MFS transporter [unclassified Erwinia]PIJ49153.1 MFS transporter [Erwinia sp. OAMSP11]PIJ70457.1 MFS transporter [Erwinia sp. OLSSP12]PIJ79950.1 MFS transporter [Erwinia sp. OLCASP19]PIJ81312.1 MFS transporter [Erwinia sp. OLMTSP26]PIJ83873.1 MFS transporter [Erwinia sp. OLMDSP33]